MEPSHKNLLRENHIQLKDQMGSSVCNVTHYLWSQMVITTDMKDSILAGRTDGEKSFQLLEKLPQRGCEAFGKFYEAVLASALWGAADILYPDKAPHPQNPDQIAEQRNARHVPPFQGSGHGSQVNYFFGYNNPFGQYEKALNQEEILSRPGYGYSYPPHAIQPAQGHLQQPPSSDGQGQQMAYLDIQCDSPRPSLSIQECQDRISKFQVPLNINDYIMLAALEGKAQLEERKAHTIVTDMVDKAKEYIAAKIRDSSANEHTTPEEAKHQYVLMSSPQNRSLTDFRFFQVWGMFQPLVGPYILAFNHQKIMFLDFGTKNKEILHKSMASLHECKKSNDDIFSVILKFQDHTKLTLLSLEYEDLYKELQSAKMCKI